MARVEFSLTDGQPVYEGSSDTSQYCFFGTDAKFSTLPFKDQKVFLEDDMIKLELFKNESPTGDFFFLRIPGSIKGRIEHLLQELDKNPGQRRLLELNLEFEETIKRISTNLF